MAASLGLPILVIQGDRDQQVSADDFAGWQRALGGRPNAVVKSYPGLNHFLMQVSESPSPREALLPGHVAVEVVQEIADWVLADGKSGAGAGTATGTHKSRR
jgi:fermentation-respiration switch protein FrsA (DUF1100 family)